MGQVEWILYLTASSFYSVSAVIYVISTVFQKEKWLKYGAMTAAAGLVPHTASLYIRWVESGHGPYMTMHEVFSSYAWVAIIMFLLVLQWTGRVRLAGLVVMPVSFILMGLGASVSRTLSPVPPSLNSYWLIAHVGFAKLAFGGILLGTGLGVIYLLKLRQEEGNGSERMQAFLDRFPTKEVADEMSYKFVAAGFLFLSIMIASGSIWAYQTWGRYWGWDPIETWSLIAWLVYGIYLHQRLNANWRGKRTAWMLVFNIFILAFASFGAGFVYEGLHSAYMTAI